MNTAVHHLNFQRSANQGYAGKLIGAARTLLDSLFAADLGPAEAAALHRLESSQHLNRMAANCEHVAPNLSAELRYIASRG